MLIKKLTKSALNEVYEISKEQFGASGWQFELFEEELQKPDHYGFVGKVKNEIVCFLFFMFTYGLKGEEYNILNIATKRGHENKGYASEMLNYLVDYSQKTNIENLWLEVDEKNINAIDLYKRFGFKIDYIRKKYYSNGDNAIIMSYNLN